MYHLCTAEEINCFWTLRLDIWIYLCLCICEYENVYMWNSSQNSQINNRYSFGVCSTEKFISITQSSPSSPLAVAFTTKLKFILAFRRNHIIGRVIRPSSPQTEWTTNEHDGFIIIFESVKAHHGNDRKHKPFIWIKLSSSHSQQIYW